MYKLLSKLCQAFNKMTASTCAFVVSFLELWFWKSLRQQSMGMLLNGQMYAVMFVLGNAIHAFNRY